MYVDRRTGCADTGRPDTGSRAGSFPADRVIIWARPPAYRVHLDFSTGSIDSDPIHVRFSGEGQRKFEYIIVSGAPAATCITERAHRDSIIMKRTIFRTSLILAPLLILVGCATVPANVALGSALAPKPVDLSPGYDAGFLRVDLKRATHIETRMVFEQDDTGKVVHVPEIFYVDDPYSFLTVYFGNGLTVDSNGNLFVDLLRLFGLDNAKSFDLTQRMNNTLFGAGLNLAKNGNVLTRTGRGLSVQQLTVTSSGDTVRMSDGPGRRRMVIVRAGNVSTFEPNGRAGFNSITISGPTDGEAVLSAPGQKTIFSLKGPDRVVSSDGLQISSSNNRIEIVERTPGGISGIFSLQRTENGCVITSPDGYGTTTIVRSGSEIYVSKDGRLVSTVSINALSM